jgi:parvulin-like peptidyl-prolyl isomerase
MLVAPSQAEQSFIVDMAGPERRFRFVQFASADFPRERVVEYGEANRERFRSAELSVITVTSRQADADAIRQQAIDRVASFEDLARNQSTDAFAADGGSMGSVYFHELELDFETLAPVREIFELNQGAISPVYETQFGWVIYRMDGSPVDPTSPTTLSSPISAATWESLNAV